MAQLSATVRNLAVNRINQHFNEKINALTLEAKKNIPSFAGRIGYLNIDDPYSTDVQNILISHGYSFGRDRYQTTIYIESDRHRYQKAVEEANLQEIAVKPQVEQLNKERDKAIDAMHFYGAEDALAFLNNLIADPQEGD